ncbi:unnamed protein product [Caenorhabditis bovis]|uniref:Uncharacterized protein n=1 Tax=Caenorhabditis bovis TaxID=2654633 RepID=A0A8S1F4U4_9PELO|nr:unnamed protein product [Caenorhabditis bovis]
MGAKCCAPAKLKLKKRLVEYDEEAYTPSRSVSQDVEMRTKSNSNVMVRNVKTRVSTRSEGQASGVVSQRGKVTSSTANLTLPYVKHHTIRASDSVPIIRLPRPPSKIETQHVIHGSIGSKLNDVSGSSVVRDSSTGREMSTNRSGSQPPGKVTYTYKVGATERRIEYRFHSETLLYDFEETRTREQLETWTSHQPSILRNVETIRKCIQDPYERE